MTSTKPAPEVFYVVVAGHAYGLYGPYDFETAQVQAYVRRGHVVAPSETMKTTTLTIETMRKWARNA